MEWISVKDRVPTETAKCLVTIDWHGTMVLFAKYDAEKEAFYDETGGVFYRDCGFCHENGTYKLTAWMPAPKAYGEETPQATIEDTVRCAFMDLISDSMGGKYKGFAQSAMIEECYERVIDAIRYQQGNQQGKEIK